MTSRVTLALLNVTDEQSQRLNDALLNGEHVNLADVFGTSRWLVTSRSISLGPDGMDVRVEARAMPQPFDTPAKDTDKFGSRTA